MEEMLPGRDGAVREAARRGSVDVERLTARIRVLLEEAAHQGALALRLLVEARELYGLTPGPDDETLIVLMRDIERRLAIAEREARQRLRRSRLCLVPPPRVPSRGVRP